MDIPISYEWPSQSGSCRLRLVNEIEEEFASVLVQNFTFNCGIRALSKISIVYQQFASLWLLTIESWLYYIGYTYAVASDGSSSGIINNLLMNHGIDWHREVLDRNRNSYPGTSLWLYWKKLDPTQLEINWLDALQKANP